MPSMGGPPKANQSQQQQKPAGRQSSGPRPWSEFVQYKLRPLEKSYVL
jgi:hypothetical protein